MNRMGLRVGSDEGAQKDQGEELGGEHCVWR